MNALQFIIFTHLQSAFLEVVIPPDIISEETSNDMMVPEGGAAKLVCKARGYPKPDIVWKREDGTEIISRAGLSGGKTKSKGLQILFRTSRSLSPFLRTICNILRTDFLNSKRNCRHKLKLISLK